MGGWFVKPSRLPMEGLIAFTDNDGDTMITVSLWDRMGIGFFDGHLRKRYAAMFESVVEDMSGVID
jgi:hypothetical protein